MRLDDDGNGVTRDSLRFFHDNQHKLQGIVLAEVRFPGFTDPFDPYLMVLTTPPATRCGCPAAPPATSAKWKRVGGHGRSSGRSGAPVGFLG